MNLPQNQYRDLIFTNHALNRLQDRSLTPDAIYQVIHSPDRVQRLEHQKRKFMRQLHHRRYQVVAEFRPDQKSWIVISAWVRGEADRVPLVWLLLTAPFRLLIWILTRLAVGVVRLLQKLR